MISYIIVLIVLFISECEAREFGIPLYGNTPNHHRLEE
jgi:hypothetical protein